MARFDEDVLITKTLAPARLTAPIGCIPDNAVPAGANINATKLMHRHEPVYTQQSGANVASERRFFYMARGSAETIQQIQVAVKQAITGNSTVTVDILKNGVSILSAVTTINNTLAAFANLAAAVTTSGMVQGDCLEVNVVATAGTGTLPQGLVVLAQIDQNTP